MKLFWKDHTYEMAIGAQTRGIIWKEKKPYRAEIDIEELVNLERGLQKTNILLTKVRMCLGGPTKHIKDLSMEKYVFQSIDIKG